MNNPTHQEIMQVLRATPAGLPIEVLATALGTTTELIRPAITVLDRQGEIFQCKTGFYAVAEPQRADEEVIHEAKTTLKAAEESNRWTESELLTIPNERKTKRIGLYKIKEDIDLLETLMKDNEMKYMGEIAEAQTETVPGKWDKTFSNEASRRAELRIRLGKDAKYQTWEKALKTHRKDAFELEVEIDRLKERHFGIQTIVELKRSQDWESYTKATMGRS